MLHRLKLRLLYGAWLDADPAVRRKKMRVILLSGFGVYFPFLAIAYFVVFETRTLHLILIGLLSALTCIPVVGYAYTKGLNIPFSEAWQKRKEELVWLAFKIGFLYGLFLYFMILGVVEFLFGYHVMRAAMISFVAAAVARDGFEIGYLLQGFAPPLGRFAPHSPLSIFPDGQPISSFLKIDPVQHLLVSLASLLVFGGIGFFLGPYLSRSVYQVLVTGITCGVAATVAYLWTQPNRPSWVGLIRLFLWPGFIMSVSYFLTLAYLLRILLQIFLLPSYDLALLMALSATWLIMEIRFVGYLKQALPQDTVLQPQATVLPGAASPL
jgi:hypothetical protein